MRHIRLPSLLLVSILVFFALGQAGRDAAFQQPTEHGSLLSAAVAGSYVLALLVLAAGAIWSARVAWLGTIISAGLAGIGAQVGRLASDYVTGRSGESVTHDIWFGQLDYLLYWSYGGAFIVGFLIVLALAMLLPLKLLSRRWRDA